MSKQSKTAGKTAERAAASAARFDETHRARIARWRKHAEEYARLTPEDRVKYPGRENDIKTVELVAEAEGLGVVDYIISHLVKSRIATKKGVSSSQEWYDEADSRYESYSPRTRNAHEKEIVSCAFRHAQIGLPKSLRHFRRDEIESFVSRFYRKGDQCMLPAVMRAISYAVKAEVA